MSTKVAFHYCECRDLAVKPFLQKMELCFDHAGYIPYLSAVSGGIRKVMGQALLVSSVALAAIFAFASCCLKGAQRKMFQRISLDLLRFAMHGAANVGRGYLECYRWYNLLWLLYDNVTKNEQQTLRLHYDRPIFGLPVFALKVKNTAH